jgi:hypothetical protein
LAGSAAGGEEVGVEDDPPVPAAGLLKIFDMMVPKILMAYSLEVQVQITGVVPDQVQFASPVKADSIFGI